MNSAQYLRSLSVVNRLLGNYISPGAAFVARNICGSSAKFSAKTDNPDNDKMDKLEVNPYFAKYAKKISEVEKTSPEEFLARLEVLKKNHQKPSAKSAPAYKERGFTEVESQSAKPKSASQASYMKGKTLDSIMKIDLINDKSAEEITALWLEYHRTQEKIAAVIPLSAYNNIFERAKDCPTFLYPLPREQGYEFIMSQFDGHACHFTSLVNFQAFKEDAPECFTIHHFTELQDNKGIVLMSGEYNKEVLSGADALCLANQLKLYYTAQPDETKYKLLTSFTKSPDTFKHLDLIAELQNFAL